MTTLLLVHAFPLDASMWRDQAAALSSRADVLAPHLPGFGDTPGGGEALTVDAMADFLAADLDRVGARRAVVCGLSMGGYAAFAMWRRHRERIAALILADTRAEPDDEAGAERRRTLARTVMEQGSTWLADNPPPLLSAGASPMLWDRVRDVIRHQQPEAIAAASLGMAARPDSRPDLATIDVPTLVVVGAEDALTPPAMAETIARGVPGAELVILDGAGHLSNLEAPEGFGVAVGRFLDRLG